MHFLMTKVVSQFSAQCGFEHKFCEHTGKLVEIVFRFNTFG